jgi:hypothetical protein
MSQTVICGLADFNYYVAQMKDVIERNLADENIFKLSTFFRFGGTK